MLTEMYFQASYTVIYSSLYSSHTQTGLQSYNNDRLHRCFFFFLSSFPMPTHSGKCLIVTYRLRNWWSMRWSAFFTAKCVWWKSPELHSYLLNLCASSYPPFRNKCRQYNLPMCWRFTVSLCLTCHLLLPLLWCHTIADTPPLHVHTCAHKNTLTIVSLP